MKDNKTVLIVEDEKVSQTTLSYILKKQKYDVWVADNGKTGFELSKINRPDVIISDVMMPVVNGYEMVQKIRNEIPDYNPIIFILTSKGKRIEEAKSLISGANGFLTKPFNLIRFTETMDSFLTGKMESIYFYDVLNELAKLEQFVYKIQESWQLSEIATIRLRLTIHEIIINIGTHGSLKFKPLFIKVVVQLIAGQKIRVEINDNGMPFDYGEQPGLVDPESPGGRGIFLLHSLAREVKSYHDEVRNLLTYEIVLNSD